MWLGISRDQAGSSKRRPPAKGKQIRRKLASGRGSSVVTQGVCRGLTLEYVDIAVYSY